MINEHFPIFERRKGHYLLSTDKAKLDVETVYKYLSEEAYWSTGIKREVIDRAMTYAMSFGIYFDDNGRLLQAGYGRVTSDYAKFAYIADVFVLEPYQGNGLGKWLMESILMHPELKDVGWWHLHTKDAQGLYEQFGFSEYPTPDRYLTFINKKED
ncbi:MAG: GNAT family N-acetyltransferase [Chloroflexota bacterium]